jgi:carboxyl-terminal processing protease
MVQLNSKKLLIAIALIVTALTLDQAQKTNAVLNNSHKAIVDQAWQLLDREYVDRSFNGQDWQAVRREYLSREYSSKEEAYASISTMVNSLADQYTQFLPPENLKDLVNNVSGEFVGVGLTATLDAKTREWIVVEPYAESPAEAAGLQANDVILRINGTKTPEIDLNEAAPHLIGPVGSKVTLEVRRDNKSLTFNLVREQINLNPLGYEVRQSAKGLIGYIHLPIFTTKSPAAMERAIKDLEAKQVVGYVLDLRGNPGGVLESGVAIAQQWLPKGRIMSLVNADGSKEEFHGDNKALTQKPLLVLVDHQSASASEVLAAALQDNHRATLIGDQTFGKGVVQSLEQLGDDGAGMVITTAKYFTPQGQNIHRIGIKPDILIPSQSQGNPPIPKDPNQDQAYQRALEQFSSPGAKKATLPKPVLRLSLQPSGLKVSL